MNKVVGVIDEEWKLEIFNESMFSKYGIRFGCTLTCPEYFINLRFTIYNNAMDLSVM